MDALLALEHGELALYIAGGIILGFVGWKVLKILVPLGLGLFAMVSVLVIWVMAHAFDGVMWILRKCAKDRRARNNRRV